MDVKLIDILVQELPKRGGWPEGAVECCRHKGANSIDFYDETGNWDDDCYLKYGEDFAKDCIFEPKAGTDFLQLIYRSEYEAALAASKPEWDGEGLPPVGCRVEASYGGEWVEATVAYTDRPESHGDAVAWKEALVFDCKTTRPFWADEFRPIRSEADKKRETFVNEANEIVGDIEKYPTWLSAIAAIYDAIKSGKIVID